MNRKSALGASTALVLSLILCMAAPALAERDDDQTEQVRHHQEKTHGHAERPAARHQAPQNQEPRVQDHRSAAREAAPLNDHGDDRRNRGIEKQQQQQAERAERDSERRQLRETRQAEQQQLNQQRASEREAANRDRFNHRLSDEEFRARERDQRREFAEQLENAHRNERLHIEELQRQHRLAQYRLQQDYFSRLERQRLALLHARELDYARNPAFYTYPAYGYYRDGRYFETSRYGGSVLQQAVNYGCRQGYAAGVADREDRWPYSSHSITSSYIYQDANYGYSGVWVPRSEYNYYFRQGYRRCYRDGYYGGGGYANDSLLETVLNLVLGLQLLR